MEALEFKKLLFKTAFCVMVCDGDIDDREIEEMKFIDTQTSYFKDIDLSKELDQLIKEVQKHGKQLIKDLLQTLRETKLSPVEELLVLEVAIRIINADQRVDEYEIKFLNHLRSKLEIDNEIIRDRFGDIPYLNNISYQNIEREEKAHQEFVSNIELPEIGIFNKINFLKSKT